MRVHISPWRSRVRSHGVYTFIYHFVPVSRENRARRKPLKIRGTSLIRVYGRNKLVVRGLGGLRRKRNTARKAKRRIRWYFHHESDTMVLRGTMWLAPRC